MSPNPVLDYAALNARVRGMYSTLLSRQTISNLSEASDLEALFSVLKHTSYGPYLERLKDKELNARRAAFLIRSRLSETYHQLIKESPEYTRALLNQFYRYYEVNNLKAVLRGIVTRSTWDRVRFVLFPFGPEGVIPAQAMIESGNVTQAVEMLRGTTYYNTLTFAMKRYNVEQSLFPIEVALDLEYWRTLWKEVNSLPKSDKKQAVRIIGSLLDMNNLMWAIRYRVYHNLSEEEVINYTLPIGYRVSDEDIRNIAAGAEIAPIVKRLYPMLQSVDELLQEPHTGLPKLEHLLEMTVVDHCRVAFMGDPFQIGIPLGYLKLFDLEIQDLVVLFEAKATHIALDDYKKYLLTEIER